MVSSITTLASPHNGTHASDELGNEALVRQVVFDVGKAFGRKNSRVDFGLAQWGLKQNQMNHTSITRKEFKILNYGNLKIMVSMILHVMVPQI